MSMLKAQQMQVTSPDKSIVVKLDLNDGKLQYAVMYENKVFLEPARLGLKTSVTDLGSNLQYAGQSDSLIDEHYENLKIKNSKVHYVANEKTFSFVNADKKKINVIFRVSNRDVAFCYDLPQTDENANYNIVKEYSSFDFPQQTTTFLTPQAPAMSGWKHTKPSYEEEYIPDAPLGQKSKYGIGFTFPALYHIANDGWVLLSETGVGSQYCASKLSEGTAEGRFEISFAEPGENNGIGAANPSVSLPSTTPWRTITLGKTLKPIVETTVAFDLVKQQYAPSIDYKFGRSTWSWLMWQDNSIRYEDQIAYIDLAAQMGFEFCLIDGLWDKQIGKAKVEELIRYAQSKHVDIYLWYNSNGYWNDAPQGPKNQMNTSRNRQEEMQWMQKMGVKGIKVDFFGGDKQITLQLYEDILVDANKYGLGVIFHGCTLPRGW